MNTLTTARFAEPQHQDESAHVRHASERGDSVWLGQYPAQSEIWKQYQYFDRFSAAMQGSHSSGLLPLTLAGAFLDWWGHLVSSPAKYLELLHMGVVQGLKLFGASLPLAVDGVEPLPQDKRFTEAEWNLPAFRLMSQAFLLTQQWWACATTGVSGVNKHYENMVSFGARQFLDVVAPSNFVLTNPVVLKQTFVECGRNLLRGAVHVFEDALHEALDLPPVGAESYVVGERVAVTPGRVILRNPLVELIQYHPTTATTYAEPVLVISAWIMKYYILDLSPQNSLVKTLVDHGFTVFAISWKNPDGEDRDLGLTDYYRLGIRAALDAIDQVMPGARVHALGYCLGGTLLTMAAAALKRAKLNTLKSVTLLAAQTDFTDPGELSLFIDESQVTFLEHQMRSKGYLDEKQMKATFQMLRSEDLIWSYRLHNYMLGLRRPATDLMAWNADGTRLPFRMHSEYLRALFLQNALAHGAFQLEGQAINLADIDVPIFSVGAVQDHVAPWRSVFQLHRLTDADQTFVLTAGGHNVGIVNPPGDARASYRIRHWQRGERRLTPDEWREATPQTAGSWWTAWLIWLAQHSSGQVPPPPLGAPQGGLAVLEKAPGLYVRQR